VPGRRNCGGCKVGHAIREVWGRRVAVTEHSYLAEVVAPQLNDACASFERVTGALGVPRSCSRPAQGSLAAAKVNRRAATSAFERVAALVVADRNPGVTCGSAWNGDDRLSQGQSWQRTR